LLRAGGDCHPQQSPNENDLKLPFPLGHPLCFIQRLPDKAAGRRRYEQPAWWAPDGVAAIPTTTLDPHLVRLLP